MPTIADSKSFGRCFPIAVLLCMIFSHTAMAWMPLQESRTWKDSSGKFEIKAKLVGIEGNSVILEKADGKQITVELDRLSPVDQGYIEGRRSSMGSEDSNPFKERETGSESANSSSGSGSNEMRTFHVDYTGCSQQGIQKGNWAPGLADQSEPTMTLKSLNLNEADGRMVEAVFNTRARRAVISYHTGRGRDPGTTRMQMVDLESGQTLADASGEGKWTALAINDDGKRVVVQNQTNGEESMDQLGTVLLENRKIVPLDLWKPYESMEKPVKEKVVRFARFINDGRLLTLSQNGHVVIWDFENRSPLRRFNYHGACQPSLSNDRKYLAICGGDIFGLVNLDDVSETPSVQSAPGMNYWLSSCFSPSCKRFAAATGHKVMVWDVASGDVLFEGNIPGIPTNGRIYFPDEDFVMVNNDKLIEFSSRIKLWRYHGSTPRMVDGQMVFVNTGRDGGKVMPVSVPHQAALDLLDEAKKQSDLFILKKDAPVGLDLSGVPAQYRGDVEQSLKENIERTGFRFARDADVTLKAEIQGPSQEAVSYHFAGSFVVRQFVSKLTIEYQGKSIWGSQATNIPGMVSGDDRANIKKQLDQAGRKPNISFYGGTHLPEYLQKPNENSSGHSQTTLGESRVDQNGIN